MSEIFTNDTQRALFIKRYAEQVVFISVFRGWSVESKELVCYTTCINPQPHFFQKTLICFRDIIFFVKRYIFIENEQLKLP